VKAPRLHPAIGTAFGAGAGLVVGASSIWLVSRGTRGIAIAIAGGIAASITIRGARIVNRTVKGVLAGVIGGFLASVAIVAWAGLEMGASVNGWAGLAFVVVQGVMRMVVPDRVLGRWLGQVMPRLVAERVISVTAEEPSEDEGSDGPPGEA
jgi:hypothetical protein